MAAIFDDAVCIRHWDWSETSQTVSLFSRGHGIIRALAKGAKRPNAPFSGGVELLSRGEAGFILKSTSDLAVLTGWDLQEIYPVLRRSLVAYNTGLYLADLVQHFMRDNDPHPGLFDALVTSLRAIERVDELPAALLGFQWSVLLESGYRPMLDRDASTGLPLRAARAYLFSPSLGGVVAPPEGAAEPPAPSPTAPFRFANPHAHHDGAAWPVRAGTVALLRRLDEGGGAATGDGGLGEGPETIDRANRLLASYLRHLLGKEPRTLPVLFGHNLPG